MTKHLMKLLALLILGFSLQLAPGSLRAQVMPLDDITMERSKARRAASLVRLGRIEEAAALYIELLYANPKNGSFYSQLVQLMPGKENAPTLLQILDDILKEQDNNLRLVSERGRLLYLLERKQEAMNNWNEIIQKNAGKSFIYPTVTRAMLEAGAFDEAIQLLIDGRVALQDPNLFAMDLARIYAAKQNYVAASREYLTQLDRHPRMLNQITTMLLRFYENAGAAESVDQSFVEILSTPGEHVAVLLARAKLYIHEKKYDECAQTVLLTDVNKSLGDVFSIANDLLADEAWTQAGDLYLYISSNSKDKQQQGLALLNLAYTYEYRLQPEEKYLSLGSYYGGNSFLELDINFISDGDASLERTLELYDSLLTMLPRTAQAFQASHHIAEIQLTYSGDVDRAIRGFEHIFANAPDEDLRYEGGLRLVDAWLAKGDPKTALKVLDRLIVNLNLDEDEPEIVASRIMILIHQGDIGALKKELLNLSGAASIRHPLYNDGMELSSLLDGNGAVDDPRLQKYLKAERLIGQHKLTEAIDLLLDIQGPATSIADDARVRAVQLLLALKKTDQATQIMDKFLDEYSESDWRPTVLIWRGEQFQFEANNPQAAIPYYESVIIEHPGYLGIQEIRLRLRNILGAGS